jgi:MFS family permease
LSSQRLEPAELSLGGTLAAIVALRMLGLFLVLPVFMVLARDIPGYSPALAGFAIGVYGLTQAVQQPFGRLSDRWGRRRVILLGLALFSLGGAVAALADSMTVLVAGRALQGCGAIAGVTLAFAADHTRPERRPVVMALIGIGIGASFLVSIMLSVPLAAELGLGGLFWLTSAFGVLGMLLVMRTPRERPPQAEVLQAAGALSSIWPLALSVFLIHALMTTVFVVLPGSLIATYGMPLGDHWKIYVPTMLASAILVFPVLRRMAHRRAGNNALPWAFGVLALSLAALARPLPMMVLLLAATVFFLAFNLLEAAMPSLVSRMSGADGRGRKMGIYTTFQFLGAFTGGAAGGLLLMAFGGSFTLYVAAAACLTWAMVSGKWFSSPEPALG